MITVSLFFKFDKKTNSKANLIKKEGIQNEYLYMR